MNSPQEMKRLLDEATDGPWLYEDGGECNEGCHYIATPKTVCDRTTVVSIEYEAENIVDDLKLICALRNRASSFLRLWEWAENRINTIDIGRSELGEILADISSEGEKIGVGE